MCVVLCVGGGEEGVDWTYHGRSGITSDEFIFLNLRPGGLHGVQGSSACRLLQEDDTNVLTFIYDYERVLHTHAACTLVSVHWYLVRHTHSECNRQWQDSPSSC